MTADTTTGMSGEMSEEMSKEISDDTSHKKTTDTPRKQDTSTNEDKTRILMPDTGDKTVVKAYGSSAKPALGHAGAAGDKPPVGVPERQSPLDDAVTGMRESATDIFADGAFVEGFDAGLNTGLNTDLNKDAAPPHCEQHPSYEHEHEHEHEQSPDYVAKPSDLAEGHTLNPLDNSRHQSFAQGGDTIKQRFIIQKTLGQGGMGMVCSALDLRKVEADDTEATVAIKLLSADFKQHPDAFKTLQREAKKTQALAHPNIITVYDFDRDGDTVYMTMELLDGEPLDEVLQGRSSIELTPALRLSIIKEIAEALSYAHTKGIIHSDLKPANVFVTRQGKTKVLDFGIARAMNTEAFRDNFDVGDLNALTPRYASLAMFEHQAPDPRDDIYALGLIAAELLVGEHPYQGHPAIKVKTLGLKPQFGPKLSWLKRQWLSRTIALDASERVQSARIFLQYMDWALHGFKRLLVVSVGALVLVTASLYTLEQVDDEIAFSALTAEVQQQVLAELAQAKQALQFGDLNGALVYLQQVYGLHPDNRELRALKAKVLVHFNQMPAANDADALHFWRSQIEALGAYGFMAKDEDYLALRTKAGLLGGS